MSFDIQGVGSAQNATHLRTIGGGGATAPVTPSGVQAQDDAVEVQTMPVAPPPEVMDAISFAADASDRLEAGGHQLQFGLEPTTGRLTIHLQALDGNTLSSLKPSQVLAIADGNTP